MLGKNLKIHQKLKIFLVWSFFILLLILLSLGGVNEECLLYPSFFTCSTEELSLGVLLLLIVLSEFYRIMYHRHYTSLNEYREKMAGKGKFSNDLSETSWKRLALILIGGVVVITIFGFIITQWEARMDREYDELNARIEARSF